MTKPSVLIEREIVRRCGGYFADAAEMAEAAMPAILRVLDEQADRLHQQDLQIERLVRQILELGRKL